MDSRTAQDENEPVEEVRSRAAPPIGTLLWLSLVVLLGSYLCTTIYSAAFFGHLALGRWIVSHLRLPEVDLWTLAAHGKTWRSEAWLFEVLISLVESMLGEKGLLILKLVLFSVFVGAASFCFSARSGDRFFGTFVAFVVSCGVLLGVCLEARVLGWIFLVVSLELGGRFESDQQSKISLLPVFFLGLFYANSHSSSLLGLLILTMLLLSERDRPKSASLLFLAVFAAGQLATPYFGAQVYSSLAGFLNFLSMELNNQTNPATIFQYPAAFLLLLLIVLGYLWHCHPWTLRSAELLLVLFSAVAGLGSRSLLPYALILCGLICARLWGRVQGSGLGNLGLALAKFEHQLSRLPAIGVVWVVLCLIIVNVGNLIKAPLTSALMPAAETDFIIEEKLPFPLLHESAVGPYLQYRFSDEAGNPKQLVAITPAVSPIAPGFASAEMFLKDLHPGWEKFFALVAPKTVLCRTATPLYEVLVRDENWELIFKAGHRTGSGEEPLPSRRSLLSWAVFKAKSIPDAAT